MRRAGSTATAFMLLVAMAIFSCSRPAADNLLFVSFDTTRADHLGAYGYALDTSPAIDRLASQGVLFEWAFAHVPSTLPSHTSMFTGLLPPSHGVRCNGKFSVSEEQSTLAEILNDHGLETAAVVGAFPLERRFGLQQGFEMYDDRFADSILTRKQPSSWLGYEVHGFRRSAEEVTDRALEWLGDRDDRWFLFVHYFDPHTPYERRGGPSDLPPYDAEISYADRHLARLLSAVEKMPGRTLVVFTADHGESLGDHGEEGHSRSVYNSTVRVPLIMVLEDTIEPGLRIRTNVGHIDLLPTILELFGIEAPPGVSGRSLMGTMTGEKAAESTPYYSESVVGVLEGSDSRERRSLIAGKFKLIRTEVRGAAVRKELFDLALDPGETTDLSEEHADRSAQLENELHQWRLRLEEAAPTPVAIELDKHAREKLRSLGYLQ